MTIREIVYNNRDNKINLLLKANDIAHDLSSVTRILDKLFVDQDAAT